MKCSLTARWSDTAWMTDASPQGYGVVKRAAPLDEIRREAVYAEKRGWVVAVDAEFTGVELAEEDSQDEAVHLGASPPS